MIELTEGRLVEWKEGDDWKVGRVMVDKLTKQFAFTALCGSRRMDALVAESVLVKRSPDGPLVFVEYGKLCDYQASTTKTPTAL